MTACVDNKEKKGGAAKAVSATLAGVLAVGMVPAVAFATPDDGSAEAEGDIELLATVSDKTAFENGKVTAFTNCEETDATSFVADGAAHYVVPTEVTPAGENTKAISLLDENGNFDTTKYTAYYNKCTLNDKGEVVSKDENLGANETGQAKCTEPGDYYVAVKRISDGATIEHGIIFSIEAASFDGAYIYTVDGDDLTDTTFEYQGAPYYFGPSNGNLNVAIGDKVLVNPTDYTAQIFDVYGNQLAWNELENAGDYKIVINGAAGTKYEGATKEIDLTIEQFDLTNAKIVINNGTVQSINGNTALAGMVEAVEIDGPEDGGLGRYTYKVQPKNDSVIKNNITGSQEVVADKYANTVKFRYNAKDWVDIADQDLADSYKINHANGDADFDLSKIAVLYDNDAAVDASYYTIEVTDKDGNVVDNSSITEPGLWYVTITMDASKTDFTYGGVKVVELDVTDGTIYAPTDVFVTYDGKLFTGSKSVTYDGTNQMDKLAVSVIVEEDGADKTLVEGTDYTVAYQQLNENGRWVDVTDITNVGSYRIVIKGAGYDMTTEIIDFNVTAVQVTAIQVDPTTQVDFTDDGKDNPVYPFVGEDIVPVIQYDTGKDTQEATPKSIFAELPAGAYEISYKIKDEKAGKWVAADAINEPGRYQITIKDVKGTEADAINYSIPAPLTIEVTVSDEGVFADVPTSEWYAPYVFDAAKKGVGYMTGYAGTNLFGPHNYLLRGEAATVLFRMAGGETEAVYDIFGDASEIFGDVDATLYYNTPIAWAHQANIITGYEDGANEGLFCPDNAITREEFCTMLYRYAQVTNQLGDETEADLSAYPDADAISTWAQDAVEWAVANEIFGGDVTLRPNDNISRAEVAKMIVTLQAEPLTNQFEQ